MTDIWPLLAALALGAVALFSKRLGDSPVTVPMVCLLVGVLLFSFGEVPFDVMDEGLRVVAKITLGIVLFTDAAHLKLARLKGDAGWPMRMLLLGIPLAIIFGVVALTPLFPDLPFWQVALIAALLAPTDAALGQAVFSNPAVPERIRDTLTAESGLNDGLALPAIIFIACAAVGFDHDLDQGNWVWFAAKQISVGLAVGAGTGALGGWLSHTAISKGFATEANSAIFALLLIAISYFAADHLGGNGFVSVFLSGLFFGRFANECADRARSFLDTEGQLLMMISFLYIGAILVPNGLQHINWSVVFAAVLALFVVRPAAIALSLVGSGADFRTKIFLGWFGPRGLATALFSLLVLSEFHGKLESDTIMAVTGLVVLASTILHGASAHFAGRVFGSAKD